MTTPLDVLQADPWTVLDRLLDGPLHPGGTDATEALLDRAEVDTDTRVLELGCGAGEGVRRARSRGATAVGLDLDPRIHGAIRGTTTEVPCGDARFDVVIAECVLCLVDDYAAAIGEAARVLRPGGRLALSDVVLERAGLEVDPVLSRVCCLDGRLAEDDILNHLENNGFDVVDRQDHRQDLLSMRDRVEDRIDYRGLLHAMGSRGRGLLPDVERVEAAVEAGDIRYISIVASRDGWRTQRGRSEEWWRNTGPNADIRVR